MTTLRQYVIATRPWSFSMSAISVTLGTLVAWRSGPIHWGAYAAVVVGMVLTHAAGNVLNDYFDSRNQVDQPDSPTVKYRPHPILGGLMSPRTLLVGGGGPAGGGDRHRRRPGRVPYPAESSGSRWPDSC